jgi:hypothetical protein
MSSPLTCSLDLCLGEFLYVHLEDKLNQAACGDFFPGYCLVESGRLWQLAIEKWIFARDFVGRFWCSSSFNSSTIGHVGNSHLKVVNDILVCGQPGFLHRS